MSKENTIFRKDIIGWSLYDFANTIYSMNIVSLYLKRYIVEDLGFDDRYFDIPFSISMLFAAILLPALGAKSDSSLKKKIFLVLFTLTCCLAVGLMSLGNTLGIFFLLFLFVVANFAYEAAQPFYNALLYSVAEGNRARLISGIGVAFGYLGSILGMIIVLPFVTGSLFSLEVPFLEGGGKAASFVPTAILFFLFTIPLILWVKEKRPLEIKASSISESYRKVKEGLIETKKYPGVLRFLIADYFFEDAVMTVILNIGIYCSIVIGLSESQISLFLIVSTITAVLGSLLIGYISQKIELKLIINLIVYGWILSLILFIFSESMVIIYLLGSLVGILLGGLWTTTRPMLAELVPENDLGRFFGIFSISGRAAAVLGPLVWTTVVYLSQPERVLGQWMMNSFGISIEKMPIIAYKLAVVSLVLMMIIGLIIFRKVPLSRRTA